MEWEFDILYALQSIHNPVLDRIMVVLSLLGEGGILWIVIALLFLCFKRYRMTGIQMAISMLVTLVIGNLILKNLVARDRPCWIDTEVVLLLSNPRDYSFPSGHSMNGFAAAVTIFLDAFWPVVPRGTAGGSRRLSTTTDTAMMSGQGSFPPENTEKCFAIIALLVAAAIAFSRLYNFVHFPTDVLCGIAIGSINAVLVHYGAARYLRRRQLQSEMK